MAMEELLRSHQLRAILAEFAISLKRCNAHACIEAFCLRVLNCERLGHRIPGRRQSGCETAVVQGWWVDLVKQSRSQWCLRGRALWAFNRGELLRASRN